MASAATSDAGAAAAGSGGGAASAPAAGAASGGGGDSGTSGGAGGGASAAAAAAATDSGDVEMKPADDPFEGMVPQYSLQVVHGTIAFWLGKKADTAGNSHTWTTHLRGNNNEDLSYCVSKVVFTLHHTFAEPVREIVDPPYQVQDSGWGEFEIRIKIHFVDELVPPASLSHLLKLYPADNSPQTTKRPVVAEHYDEVLFTDPPKAFIDILRARKRRFESPPNPLARYFTSYDDKESLEKIAAAQRFVEDEIGALRAKLLELDERVATTRSDIARLGGPVLDAPPSKPKAAHAAGAGAATTPGAAAAGAASHRASSGHGRRGHHSHGRSRQRSGR